MPQKPVPIEILERRGSTNAIRKRKAGVPEPVSGEITTPTWLCGEAQRMWRHLVPMLRAMRVATRADRNVLAMYCELWARWRECNEFVAKHGTSYITREKSPGEDPATGEPIPGAVRAMKPYPQARLMLQLVDRLSKLGAQLGLSPAARSMLNTVATQDFAAGATPVPDDQSKERFFHE